MSKIDELSIVKEINIDKVHIDNFKMDTEQGTKRVKEKFHKEAVINRNNYINKENVKFSNYKILLENEMVKRIKKLIPINKTNEYNEEEKHVNELFELVKLDCNISESFKLKLDYIVSSFENTSLDEMNMLIKKFIDSFKSFGIKLDINDFKYTMFCEMYMNSYFKDYKFGSMTKTFESIYFKCPDIKLQLKMNLINIINKYKKDISKYLEGYHEKKLIDASINNSDVINEYVYNRESLGKKKAIDEYYNLKIFLDEKRKIKDYLIGSPTRNKNYNTFIDDYNALTDYSKNSYNSAVSSLYLTLVELKKYYKYEFIIQDLLKRYKDRESAKNSFVAKKKEIDTAEALRESIYKKYLRASGIGLFARRNETKMKDLMLMMNEQIKKLNDLYDEFYDLEITNNLNDLSESATLYDLFLISLSSFSFIENAFNNNEEFNTNSLEYNVDEYFKFIFNPNNSFLRKTSCLVDFNIINIISEKYKLLELKVTDEMIDKDNIDSTIDTLRFINLIQNIEESSISLDTIDNIYQMDKIVSINRDNLDVI